LTAILQEIGNNKKTDNN